MKAVELSGSPTGVLLVDDGHPRRRTDRIRSQAHGADTADTATPGTTGININSGGGGSPVTGTIISLNVIRGEQVDIAVNTPNEVDAHLNDLLGGNIGVANVCGLDMAACTGTINATENYWRCAAGPGSKGCSTVSGADITFSPWLGKFY